MPKLLSLFILCCFSLSLHAQLLPESSQYEPNSLAPFGAPNPAAGEAIKLWAPMIGLCDCQSMRRDAQGNWPDTTSMVWSYKYILNGTAVQDEVWRDGSYASSVRQYQPDSAQWVVTYFSYPAVPIKPSVWTGGMEGEEIVLHKPHKATNGMDGFSRLTFYNINEEGFMWKGEWVDTNGTIVWPFLMINCKKR